MSVGISNSPIKKLVFVNLKNLLIQQLFLMRNDNFELSDAIVFSIGGLIKNIINLNLDKSEFSEIINLFTDKRYIPFLKSIKGNDEFVSSDGNPYRWNAPDAQAAQKLESFPWFQVRFWFLGIILFGNIIWVVISYII